MLNEAEATKQSKHRWIIRNWHKEIKRMQLEQHYQTHHFEGEWLGSDINTNLYEYNQPWKFISFGYDDNLK